MQTIMNTPMPPKVVHAIFCATDYSSNEVRNLTDEQLEAIDWKRVSGSRGVGAVTRKLIYRWLTERGIKSAKDVIQIDLFDQEESPKDETKLRLRILELKVEYDKAMQDGTKLNLEECYRFVKGGI